MSSAANSLPEDKLQPLPAGTQLLSASGKRYAIDAVLQQRQVRDLLFSVYRANCEGESFAIKFAWPQLFEEQVSLQKLVDSAYVRTAVDTIPEHNLLVYPFLKTNLLLVKTSLIPPALKKRIIRDALLGLADLHDKRIIHNDIKPNNIMLDINQETDGTITLGGVQITDLEDAFAIPSDKAGIHLRTYGNHFWRNPESWAKGLQNTPSDIFSLGIVAIYVWLDIMVLYSTEARDAIPEEQSRIILRKHLSFFANLGGDNNPGDFFDYYGEDDPFVERMFNLFETFDWENPAEPFLAWVGIDDQFKDLICKMTALNPRRRVTAREALQHPWFADCGEARA